LNPILRSPSGTSRPSPHGVDISAVAAATATPDAMIPVNFMSYEVFLLFL
jgi:regulatory protein NPR1